MLWHGSDKNTDNKKSLHSKTTVFPWETATYTDKNYKPRNGKLTQSVSCRSGLMQKSTHWEGSKQDFLSTVWSVPLCPVLDDRNFTNPEAVDQAWSDGLKVVCNVSALQSTVRLPQGSKHELRPDQNWFRLQWPTNATTRFPFSCAPLQSTLYFYPPTQWITQIFQFLLHKLLLHCSQVLLLSSGPGSCPFLLKGQILA